MASMSPFEKLFLNPVEFTPELAEIDLSALGIAIGQAGPNYGEASVTVERVKQAVGEGVTSAHWPSVDCEVPLIISSDPSISQAAAFKPVETFVSEVQRQKTRWLRREFADAAGFSGAVATFVDAAGITTPKGLGRIDEITLKLSRYPFWFATVEEESEEFSASEVRELEFTLAEMLGTVPGLIKLVIKNEGEEDWRGCIASLECDDYSDAPTAKPHYSAKDLTLQGGSEVAKDGDGDEVVKCPALTKGWVTVLSSEITGEGHMTHIGPRRMAFRVEDPSEKLDSDVLAEWVAGGEVGAKPVSQQVNWKLEWRALGAAAWMQTQEGSTPIVKVSPVVGDYQLLDLGGLNIPTAITGEQRWECRLQACVPSGSGVQPLVRDVYPLSTEQWMRVADAAPDPIDGALIKAPGTVEDATGAGTAAWSNPGNVKAEDGSCATAESSEKASKESHYLKATNLGFAIPSSASIKGISVEVRRKRKALSVASVEDKRVRIIKGGTVKEAQDKAVSKGWGWSLAGQSYGGPEDLWGQTWTPSDINASTFGFALSVWLQAYENPLGGTFEYGKAEVDAIKITVYYSESANTETHICFAERSVEFTDTGVRRQHATDDPWGDLVGDGMNLYAPAPSQAGRSMRGLIIPSNGDFDTRADSAAASLSAKVISRAAYLFAREAAE